MSLPLSSSGDLQVLSRSGDESRPAPHPASRGDAIPPPSFAWKTRVLFPGVLLLIVMGLLAYSARDALRPGIPVQAVPVVLRAGNASSESPATATIQAPGWVEAAPYATYVTALADGVVREVLVLEGETVEANQVVARLVEDDARLDLAAKQASHEQAEAHLAAADARLLAAQSEWDHPVERHRAVASTEALFAEAQAELERLPMEIAVEEGRAAELEDALTRTERALSGNAASEIEVVQTRLKLASQQAIVKAARARLPILEARLRQQRAELDAARENLNLRIEETKALAEAKADHAALRQAVRQSLVARDAAALRLDRMEVRSPTAGVVMQRLKSPGDVLMAGSDMPFATQVLRLYDPERLQVRVDVPLADAAGVSVGQRAQIVVGVLPDKTFDGEITRIVHEADIQKNTLQVKVAIHDPVSDLKPEMLARVKFLAAPRGQAPAGEGGQLTFAPRDAIHQGPGHAYAWVVNSRNEIEHRIVTLGSSRHDDWVAVVEGLRPGDLVVTNAPAGLEDGDRVAVADNASTANPASKGASHDAH